MNMSNHRFHRWLAPLIAVLAVAGAGVQASTAAAATAAPAWKVMTITNPSRFFTDTGRHATECASPNAVAGFYCDKYYVLLENVGAAPAEGPITATINLPAGVTIVPQGVFAEPESAACERTTEQEGHCTYSVTVPPAGFLLLRVGVAVEPGFSGPVHAKVTVEGGTETPPPPTEVVTPVGEGNGPFGIEDFSLQATGPAGEPSEQAGAHPFLATTTLGVTNNVPEYGGAAPVETIKNLVFYLPLGFLGNAKVAPRCPASLVEGGGGISGCPPSTRVGDILPNGIGGIALDSLDPTGSYGIYNVEPEEGVPAEFAFPDSSQQLFMYASVVLRHGQYVLRVSVPGVARLAKLFFVVASFFGDLKESFGEEGRTRDIGGFLTNPSDCSAENLTSEAELNTWEAPSRVIEASTVSYPRITGCEALPFSAGLQVAPETSLADEAVGYHIALTTPEAPNFAGDLAVPPVKKVTLTLPEGVSLAPGGANGLVACQENGPEGIDMSGPESEETGPDGLKRLAPGHCPGASQVASVQAVTPLLGEALNGHIFVAAPGCGQSGQHECQPADAEDGTLFRGYLELANRKAGIVVKLAGSFHVSAATGQITAVFDNNPQFPFTELNVVTAGGSGAVLATPQQCGSALASAAIEPWSASASALEPGHVGSTTATPSSAFGVGGCTPAFGPRLTAGTQNSLGGSSGTFTFSLTRADRSPDWTSVTTVLPPGLLANVASVERCPDAQANAGQCGESSEIGTVSVAAGPGSSPYRETGKVYFTGPYAGAPFGLSIVVPAAAGPFNLGLVVVRAAVRVDPADAHVTVETGPIPQIRDGVPLHLKSVTLDVDRSGFMVNPTNCSALQVAAAVHAGPAQANVSVPFAATGCKHLPFAPTASGTVTGKTSRLNGAGLTIKLGQLPGEANIARAEFEVPKVLPSRLPTLQKACTEAQFAANPAGCPEASRVGTAVAKTKLLRAPLAGPAYLVSHGGAAFPDLVFVLQGEGVVIDVVGHTDIKRGITHSRFQAVPDAPITSFETTLPQGRYSLLGSVTNLCAHTVTKTTTKLVKVHRHGRLVRVKRKLKKRVLAPLAMASRFVGQNGVERHVAVPISITGCTASKSKGARSGRATARSRSNGGR